MVRLLLWGLDLYQVALAFSASITTEEYYDDYEYGDEYTVAEAEVVLEGDQNWNLQALTRKLPVIRFPGFVPGSPYNRLIGYW